MTTLTIAAPPVAQPIRWRQLAWVVWRRYRTTLAATVGILALIAVYLVIDGRRMRSAYHSYLACTPANSAKCEFIWRNFRDSYGQNGLLATIVVLLPGIVGAFAGAPLLARELESGTFRYIWTQGVGRMRWTVAALVPGAVGVAATMGAFGTLIAWHDRPLTDTGVMPRLRATIFPVTGIAIAGWALAGFALGAAAGLLWRRVLPALATAFAAWFGLALLTASVVRLHYLTPLTTTSLQMSERDLSVDQWWTKGGVRVSDAQIDQVLQVVGVQGLSDGGGPVAVRPSGAGSVDPVEYLLQHGYTQVTSYQPDSRYWPFQWIEFGWLVVLSALLLGGALWLLRRRPA
jgi:hypothetical protein